MKPKSAIVILTILICWTRSATFAAEHQEPEHDRRERFQNDWRRDAMLTMRVAAADRLITEPAELRAYRDAGFNTLVVFDAKGTDEAGTAWNLKTEDEIRAETAFAREQGLPLVLGLAVEPYVVALSFAPYVCRRPLAPATSSVAANGSIPQATDAEIRERVKLWMKYGGDIIIGVFPWYDDVFWQTVQGSGAGAQLLRGLLLLGDGGIRCGGAVAAIRLARGGTQCRRRIGTRPPRRASAIEKTTSAHSRRHRRCTTSRRELSHASRNCSSSPAWFAPVAPKRTPPSHRPSSSKRR